MITRLSAKLLGEKYQDTFPRVARTSFSYETRSDGKKFYEFLYEREYDAWFCNLGMACMSALAIRDFIMKLHTGESVVPATSGWTWDARVDLGQQLLRKLAEDLLRFKPDTALGRSLELDGYVFQDGRLIQFEGDALEAGEALGIVEALYGKLGLPSGVELSRFMKLANEHFMEGKWEDSIANSRKILELTLLDVAISISSRAADSKITSSSRPAQVRDYLRNISFLSEKEHVAISAIYGLLSETGAHPNIAASDQARLLRQLSLAWSQFVLLRLEIYRTEN